MIGCSMVSYHRCQDRVLALVDAQTETDNIDGPQVTRESLQDKFGAVDSARIHGVCHTMPGPVEGALRTRHRLSHPTTTNPCVQELDTVLSWCRPAIGATMSPQRVPSSVLRVWPVLCTSSLLAVALSLCLSATKHLHRHSSWQLSRCSMSCRCSKMSTCCLLFERCGATDECTPRQASPLADTAGACAQTIDALKPFEVPFHAFADQWRGAYLLLFSPDATIRYAVCCLALPG